jgi:hypothetical protein
LNTAILTFSALSPVWSEWIATTNTIVLTEYPQREKKYK